MFLNNRYMDTSTGTFLSVDPLVGKTAMPYLYGDGNPVTFSDPLGLDTNADRGCVALSCYRPMQGPPAPTKPAPKPARDPKPSITTKRAILDTIVFASDLERRAAEGFVQRYQISGVWNVVTFLDEVRPARLSRVEGNLSTLQELVNLFGSYKFVGVKVDDPLITVTRLPHATLTETRHVGTSEYLPLAVYTDVDAFVVQVSQSSGIGAAASAGVKGDPTQSDVASLSSSTSIDTYIYVADFGNFRDLIEDPYGGPISRENPTFSVQIRSAG